MSTTIQEREATSVTSPVKNEPVVEPLYPVFLEAAERMRGCEWIVGEGTNCTDKTDCILLALERSSGGPKSWHDLSRLLGFTSSLEAMAWNDAPGRTLEEVLERLERAAYGL